MEFTNSLVRYCVLDPLGDSLLDHLYFPMFVSLIKKKERSDFIYKKTTGAERLHLLKKRVGESYFLPYVFFSQRQRCQWVCVLQ